MVSELESRLKKSDSEHTDLEGKYVKEIQSLKAEMAGKVTHKENEKRDLKNAQE